MAPQNLFGAPLQRDPSVALKDPVINAPLRSGPLHRVQYVVELVGQRTVPANVANALVGDQWAAALGHPEVWVMAPADNVWRALSAQGAGSYDSIALAWDLVSDQGEINAASAAHLLGLAESFANPIGRRAMPMPTPDDVPVLARNLRDVQEMLDIGFGLSVVAFNQMLDEKGIWVECTRLGLTLSASGVFQWMVPGADLPLLEVAPLGTASAFTLSSVQRGAQHPALSVGFSVPLCPAPEAALAAAIYVAEHFGRIYNAKIYDDTEAPLTDSGKKSLHANLAQALRMFAQAQIQPGSAEAVRLFA